MSDDDDYVPDSPYSAAAVAARTATTRTTTTAAAPVTAAAAPAPARDNKTHRLWVIVTNIDSEDDRHTAMPAGPDFYQYSVEKGTHLHMQGFCYYKKPVRFSAVQKAFPHSHIEVAHGSFDDNDKYTSKKDETHISGPYSWGTRPRQGSRTDLKDACAAIKTTGSAKRAAEEFPEVYVKFHRGLEAYAHRVNPPPAWRDIEVTWLWGPTGCGKTRKAVSSVPDPCDFYFAPSDGHWWDGYELQSTICFDEFYGVANMRIDRMLRLLDGYALQVEVKGGHVWARWTKVWITSNTDPALVYASECQERRDAFFRRVTHIEHMGV